MPHVNANRLFMPKTKMILNETFARWNFIFFCFFFRFFLADIDLADLCLGSLKHTHTADINRGVDKYEKFAKNRPPTASPALNGTVPPPYAVNKTHLDRSIDGISLML